MKFNLCLVKPEGYVHSDAFWELAELLAYSLRDLGHDAYISINEFGKDFCNIVFGGHLLSESSTAALPPSTIIFNTEQLYLKDHSWNRRIFELGRRLRVWDYSARNIERLTSEGCGGAALVQIGYHRRLERITPQKNRDIDVLFYGSANPRRRKVFKALRERGFNVRNLFGIYGAQRDEYISRSKLVQNMHRHNAQIFEVVRVHYLINNRVPVVCERNPGTEIDDWWGELVRGVAYEELADRCAEVLADPASGEQLATGALERLRQRPQKKITADLLRQCELQG